MLKTEAPDDRHRDLDRYPVGRLVDAFIDDQALAATAVRAASGRIADAVESAVPRIAGGGRLVYVGAGTSGRLGMLDSVELLPTFSWPPERAVAVLAGGPDAMVQAVEGAEDSAEQGAAQMRAAGIGTDDVVIGTVFAWVLGLGVLALSVYTASAAGTTAGSAGVSVLFGSIFGLSASAAWTAAASPPSATGASVRWKPAPRRPASRATAAP